MRKPFRFEKLNVWQDARKLNRGIYLLTRKFPEEERFGMTSQLRRAAVSICSNIAEGSGRNSDKDFGRFLENAYGSAMEVASNLFLASDVDLVPENSRDELLEQLNAIAGQLVALNHSLSHTESKTPFPRGASAGGSPSTLGSRL
jgi:four helix bundle protein